MSRIHREFYGKWGYFFAFVFMLSMRLKSLKMPFRLGLLLCFQKVLSKLADGFNLLIGAGFSTKISLMANNPNNAINLYNQGEAICRLPK